MLSLIQLSHSIPPHFLHARTCTYLHTYVYINIHADPGMQDLHARFALAIVNLAHQRYSFEPNCFPELKGSFIEMKWSWHVCHERMAVFSVWSSSSGFVG